MQNNFGDGAWNGAIAPNPMWTFEQDEALRQIRDIHLSRLPPQLGVYLTHPDLPNLATTFFDKHLVDCRSRLLFLTHIDNQSLDRSGMRWTAEEDLNLFRAVHVYHHPSIRIVPIMRRSVHEINQRLNSQQFQQKLAQFEADNQGQGQGHHDPLHPPGVF